MIPRRAVTRGKPTRRAVSRAVAQPTALVGASPLGSWPGDCNVPGHSLRTVALIALLLGLLLPRVARAGEWAAILIDMQPGFANAARSLSEAERTRVLRPQALVLRSLAGRGIPVAVMEYKGAWGRTAPSLLDAIGDGTHAIIEKAQNSAFSAPELEQQLAAWGSKRLIVMGANRGYCVLETVRSAAGKGFDVHLPDRLVEDYTAGPRPAIVASALALRPEFQRHATVYDRTSDLLRRLPRREVEKRDGRRLR